MPFWLFMLFCNVLIPVVMIAFGRFFTSHVPKKINYIYGYRTSMSMKNKETWEFAHHHIGKRWTKIGWWLFVLTELPMLLLVNQDQDTIAFWGLIICLVQVSFLIGSIFPTEKALREHFDETGHRIK